jgi:hypothetical protein
MVLERAGQTAMQKINEPPKPKLGTEKSAKRWRWAAAGALVIAAGVLIAYQAVRINDLSAKVALFTKIRRQEIDYVEAMAKSTFTLKPTNGMVFHNCEKEGYGKVLPEPVDELVLKFEPANGGSCRSNHWVSEFAYYTYAGRLGAVDVSGLEEVENLKLEASEVPLWVARELLRQVIAQDEGWFARRAFFSLHNPVATVYGQHPAGTLALIAYMDRENPDRVLVDYVFHLSACPARGGGVSKVRPANVAFFRPACPPWQ